MKSKIKTLYFLYGALLMGCVTMWGVALSGLNNEKPALSPEIIPMIIPGVTISLLAVSYLIPMMLGNQIQEKMTAEEKYPKVMSIFLIRWAMIEGSVVFNGVIYFIHPNQYSLIFAGLGLAIYFLSAPSKTGIIELAKLNVTEEREWFD